MASHNITSIITHNNNTSLMALCPRRRSCNKWQVTILPLSSYYLCHHIQQQQQQQQQHPFNGPFVRDYPGEPVPEGKNKLDFTEARDGEWEWHQLGHMQVCTSLQTDNHASTPSLSFFTGRMPFLPPNQHSKHWRRMHHHIMCLKRLG